MWMKPAEVIVTGKLSVTIKRKEEHIYWFHGTDTRGNQFEYTTNNREAARKMIVMFVDLGFGVEHDNKYGAPLHEKVVGASNFELAEGEMGLEMAARMNKHNTT